MSDVMTRFIRIRVGGCYILRVISSFCKSGIGRVVRVEIRLWW